MNTTLLPDKINPTPAPAGPVEHHDELARIAERVLEIPQPDTPRLTIHRTGCQVAITWTGSEESFRLETSDHAYVHGDWRPVNQPVQVAGGIHRVLLPGAAHLRYVRLARGRSNPCTARRDRTPTRVAPRQHASKPAPHTRMLATTAVAPDPEGQFEWVLLGLSAAATLVALAYALASFI